MHCLGFLIDEIILRMTSYISNEIDRKLVKMEFAINIQGFLILLIDVPF